MQIINEYDHPLLEFAEAIRSDPDADPAPRIRALSDMFEKSTTQRVRTVIYTYLLKLYGFDSRSLKRDLAKVAVLGAGKAEPSQRAALLRCLYGALPIYIKDNFAEIISLCEQIEIGLGAVADPDA